MASGWKSKEGSSRRTSLRFPVRPSAIVLGSESYTLAMERADSGWAAAFRGERHVMEVLDERTRHIRSLTGEGAKATGASQLGAPMPGLVLRIQVQQGQAVVVGQPIVGPGSDEDGKRAASHRGGGGSGHRRRTRPSRRTRAVLVEFAARPH